MDFLFCFNFSAMFDKFHTVSLRFVLCCRSLYFDRIRTKIRIRNEISFELNRRVFVQKFNVARSCVDPRIDSAIVSRIPYNAVFYSIIIPARLRNCYFQSFKLDCGDVVVKFLVYGLQTRLGTQNS